MSLWFALVLLCSVRASWADGLVRVLLVGPAGDETVAHLDKELRLLGLEVEALESSAQTELGVLAQAANAQAVAHVESWPPEVTLWVSSPTGPPDVLKVTDTIVGAQQPGILALRAVEILRARLLHGGEAPEAPSDASAPPEGPAVVEPLPRLPPPPRPARPLPDTPDDATERRLAISLAPLVSFSPGGVPPMLRIRLAGGYRIAEHLGVEVGLVAPTAAASLVEPEGEVALRLLELGGGLTVPLTALKDDWHLAPSVGLSALATFFDATGGVGVDGASGARWSAAPSLGFAAGYRVTPLFALRADLVGSVLVPHPVVRVLGREVASYGLPAVSLSVGVEVSP